MINGLKAQRRLAVYVALGLSTGGGLLFSAPSAYANDVTISSTDTAHSAGVSGTTETGDKDGNKVTIGESGAAGPAINGDVVGGYAAANDVTNNTVTINSIALDSGKAVYGGKSDTGAATGNTVTIAGGTLNSNNKIIGGAGAADSTSNGNIVNLNGGNLHGAEIWGSYYGSDNTLYPSANDKIKGNTLNVGASGLDVERLRNFENYNFNLTEKVAAGSTMLKVGDFRAFGFQTPAEWSKITLTGKENDSDKTKYGRVGTITLLESSSGGGLSINNYEVGGRTGTTGDYEYRLYTNNTSLGYPGDPVGANYVRADINRFQNTDATYNGTEVTGDTLYGGYSTQGNTVTNNKLKVTALPTGDDLKNVYAGANTGTAGDVTKNELTVGLPNNYDRLTDIYGGAITNAANAGEVSENKVVFTNGRLTSATGGASKGAGVLKKNTVTFSGENSQATTLRGAQSEGEGRVEENGVTISDGGYARNAYGAETSGTGVAEKNYVTLTGGTVGNEIAGGVGHQVIGNTVTISGGTAGGNYSAANVYGGKMEGTGAASSGNIVNLGAEDGTYTADLRNANISGDNATDSAVHNNVLNVRGKGITVNSVKNFDKYHFKLNNNIGSGDTMLTLSSGGFGREIDFANNFNVDSSALNGARPNGTITLIKSEDANALTFKEGYASRDLGSTENAEYFIGTDTGTRTASAVIMNYSVFKDNAWTYDATNPADAAEIFGGASYNGHTTENNTLTVTNTSATTWVNNAYGGKTAGARGDSRNNKLIIEHTDTVSTSNAKGISDARGGAITNAANAGAVTGNSVTVRNGSKVNVVYGGYTAGTGAVGGVTDGSRAADTLGNTVTFESGTAGNIYGGHIGNANSTADATGNSVVTKGGSFGELYGGYTQGKGSANYNTVTVDGGTSGDDVYGGYVKGGSSEDGGDASHNVVTINGTTAGQDGLGTVYGGSTVRSGSASYNRIYINGGTIDGDVYGGSVNNVNAYGKGNASNNIITITGGEFTGGYSGREIVGGKVSNSVGKAINNTINIGDGAHDLAADTNLTRVTLRGNDNSNDTTGNTLNVKTKNAVVGGVGNFENYTFHLNNTTTDGSTMLTLRNGGFGGTVDWNKFTVSGDVLSSGLPNKTITLLKSNDANELRFSNYSSRNLITDANSDFEASMYTDTPAVSGQTEHSATSVTLRSNRYRNSVWTYDGTNPATATEVAGGISYEDGHTTENNTLTVTGTPAAGLNFVYGGKTNGAADAKENCVIVESTGTGSIANINGGFTGKIDGVAENNRVLIKDGTVTNVIGGAVSGANGSATGNKVTVEGGTVQNAVVGGGGTPSASGNMSNNTVTVTGGTVSGKIIGGDSRVTTSTSNHNEVNLGGGNLAGAEVWGTSYGGHVYANDDAKIAGNTLNMQAAGMTVKKIRNFEKLNFDMTGALRDGDTMLTLSDVDGFGTVSTGGADVKVKWSNVTANLPTDLSVAPQGKNSITLLKTANNAADLKFDGYMATDATVERGVYEKKLATDTNTDTASAVKLELNRFKDGSVTHDGTTSPDEVYGGYSAYEHTDSDGHTVAHTTERNTLHITGVATGMQNLKAYGGYTGGAHGGAVNNTVHVDVQNANAGQIHSVVGGYTKGAGAVRGNTLRFSQGATLHDIMAGFIDSAASAADVTDNTVIVEGGTIGDNVYGGRTKGTGKVERNTVTLLGGTFNGDVVGGFSETVPAADVNLTNGNTVNLYGTTVNGTVYGGLVNTAVPDTHVVNGVDNTLAIYGRGTTVNDFAGVQNLHFYLPAGTTEDPAAATMLRLTKAEYLTDGKKDLSNVNVGVALAGSRQTLKVGDTVSLMKAYTIDSGNSTAVEITPDGARTATGEGMHGVSLNYKFNVYAREAQNEADASTTNANHLRNELVAEVTEVGINEQTKSLVETRAATTALINSGADLLTDSGFRAAEDAISASKAEQASVPGAAALSNGASAQMWASQGGSALRLNSGSYVDAKGWNINLGFAQQKTAGRNTITFGPLLEYGRGSYDSYLDDGTHGDGKTSYFGVGVMAKSKSDKGTYVEGSLRVGRVKSDYAGNINSTAISYDSSSTYYAAHLGVGVEKELKGGDTIDTYAKYFYAHQSDDSVRLNTGETYEFDAVDSNRIRLGARYTKKLAGGGAFYTGLAYEYEFGSEARATFDGYSTPSPTMKGGTGLLELGYRFTPKDSNVSYGVNLMGMTGKREGVSGGVQINWAF